LGTKSHRGLPAQPVRRGLTGACYLQTSTSVVWVDAVSIPVVLDRAKIAELIVRMPSYPGMPAETARPPPFGPPPGATSIEAAPDRVTLRDVVSCRIILPLKPAGRWPAASGLD